jgi:hypothetical protein
MLEFEACVHRLFIYLFICDLFKDAFSHPGSVSLNDRLIDKMSIGKGCGVNGRNLKRGNVLAFAWRRELSSCRQTSGT